MAYKPQQFDTAIGRVYRDPEHPHETYMPESFVPLPTRVPPLVHVENFSDRETFSGLRIAWSIFYFILSLFASALMSRTYGFSHGFTNIHMGGFLISSAGIMLMLRVPDATFYCFMFGGGVVSCFGVMQLIVSFLPR